MPADAPTVPAQVWELSGEHDVHSPRTPPTPGTQGADGRGWGGAVGRAMAKAGDDDSPCVTERVTRQGSSAFLKSMLNPSAGSYY